MSRNQPKRPRDFSQAAKLVVYIASGEVEDREPTPEQQGKSAKAVARGKAGGAKDGKARAARLTPEQRADCEHSRANTLEKI